MLNSAEDPSHLKIPPSGNVYIIHLLGVLLKKKNFLVVLLLRISQQWERISVNNERKAGVTHVGRRPTLYFHECEDPFINVISSVGTVQGLHFKTDDQAFLSFPSNRKWWPGVVEGL